MVKDTLAAGTVIAGRYTIERYIAGGGMGAVYAAHDDLEEATVALKLAHAEDPRNRETFVKRFRREAKIGHRLGMIAGFVHVSNWGELPEGGLFLAMTLVDGAKPLDLARTGTLEARLGRLAVGAERVAELHRQRTIHRDLKPDNFLQGSDGAIWLADFGLAKGRGEVEAADGGDVGSLSGWAMGTARYMAPEQCEDAKHADERADVYAVRGTTMPGTPARPTATRTIPATPTTTTAFALRGGSRPVLLRARSLVDQGPRAW